MMESKHMEMAGCLLLLWSMEPTWQQRKHLVVLNYDPYVVFTCNGKRKVNSIKFHTLEPQWNGKSNHISLIYKPLKDSPVHVAPACTRSGEVSGSYVRRLYLHFCKRLFLGLEPMTSWSEGNSFTNAPWLTSHCYIKIY
jgi:hypothetical protein